MNQEHIDVLVVGAGISGIGAGYYLKTKCPNKSFKILESRKKLGGTWDLFKYPGIRSDSDMTTMGFRFKPWTGKNLVAGGGAKIGEDVIMGLEAIDLLQEVLQWRCAFGVARLPIHE